MTLWERVATATPSMIVGAIIGGVFFGGPGVVLGALAGQAAGSLEPGDDDRSFDA